jgi:hypothetical protein
MLKVNQLSSGASCYRDGDNRRGGDNAPYLPEVRRSATGTALLQCANESGRPQPHSKTWRNEWALGLARQSLRGGRVRLCSAAVPLRFSAARKNANYESLLTSAATTP